MRVLVGCVLVLAYCGVAVWLFRSGSLDEIEREHDWRRCARNYTARERQNIRAAIRGPKWK